MMSSGGGSSSSARADRKSSSSGGGGHQLSMMKPPPSTRQSRHDVTPGHHHHGGGRGRGSRGYKDWNPPHLGALPQDFLRIVAASGGSSNSSSSDDEPPPQQQQQINIASLMKDELFLRELQQNEEFLREMKAVVKKNEKHNKQLNNVAGVERSISFKEMNKAARNICYDIARTFTTKNWRSNRHSSAHAHNSGGGSAAAYEPFGEEKVDPVFSDRGLGRGGGGGGGNGFS